MNNKENDLFNSVNISNDDNNSFSNDVTNNVIEKNNVFLNYNKNFEINENNIELDSINTPIFINIIAEKSIVKENVSNEEQHTNLLDNINEKEDIVIENDKEIEEKKYNEELSGDVVNVLTPDYESFELQDNSKEEEYANSESQVIESLDIINNPNYNENIRVDNNEDNIDSLEIEPINNIETTSIVQEKSEANTVESSDELTETLDIEKEVNDEQISTNNVEKKANIEQISTNNVEKENIVTSNNLETIPNNNDIITPVEFNNIGINNETTVNNNSIANNIQIDSNTSKSETNIPNNSFVANVVTIDSINNKMTEQSQNTNITANNIVIPEIINNVSSNVEMPLQNEEIKNSDAVLYQENQKKLKKNAKYLTILPIIVVIVLLVLYLTIFNKNEEILYCSKKDQQININLNLLFENDYYIRGTIVESNDLTSLSEEEYSMTKDLDICADNNFDTIPEMDASNCRQTENNRVLSVIRDIFPKEGNNIGDIKKTKDTFESLGYTCEIKK